MSKSAPVLAAQDQDLPSLSYHLDASFLHLDAVKRPQEGQIAGGAEDESSAGEGDTDTAESSRVPGLKHFRISAEWRTAAGSGLAATLRPDAMRRMPADEPYRELDTRAGTVYRPSPEVRPLDAYHIYFEPTDSLSGAYGVFEDFGYSQSSYQAIQSFGLEVRFPARFSALRLKWSALKEDIPTGAPVKSEGFLLDAYLFHGDGDRAEEVQYHEKKYDSAPVGRDPYQGGAAYLGWTGRSWLLGILAGVDHSGTSGLKRNEVFAMLTSSVEGRLFGTDYRAAVDVRQASESWRSSGTSYADRVQKSAALNAAIRSAPATWLLAGYSLGSSQRPVSDGDPLELAAWAGYQVEVGAQMTFGRNIELQGLVSQEKRTVSADGMEQAGGFVDSDGDHAIVRRIGLELRYSLVYLTRS